MQYINYEEMQEALAFKQGFKSNSVSAKWEDGRYTVYSYSTVIYRSRDDMGLYYLDNKYYSVTTSKLQNMLIRVFKLNSEIEKRDKVGTSC